MVPNGHAFDYLRAGSAASRYAPRDLPLDAIAAAKVVHLSGISLAISVSACDAALEAIAHARANGVRVSFDTNLRLKLWPLARARAVMLEAIRQTDICLPSWDDVTELTGLTGRDAIVDFLLSLGPRVVALKLGKEGAYIATPDERRVVPGHVVQCGRRDRRGRLLRRRVHRANRRGRRSVCGGALCQRRGGAVHARLRRSGADSVDARRVERLLAG